MWITEQYKQEIQELKQRLAQAESLIFSLQKELSAIQGSFTKSMSQSREELKSFVPSELTELSRRMDSLMLWKADLMGMLLEKSEVTGKTKLSSRGKALAAFYGKA